MNPSDINKNDYPRDYFKEGINQLPNPGVVNPNNCETCKYKQMNDDPELHCYMFKDEPTEVCMQHSGREFPTEFPPMQMLEISTDVSEFARLPDETHEEYKARLEDMFEFPGDEANIALAVEEIRQAEDLRFHTVTLPAIIRAYQKKLNKRKRQARARTGRRS